MLFAAENQLAPPLKVGGIASKVGNREEDINQRFMKKVDNMNESIKKTKKGGRKPKTEKANHRYTVNFTEKEKARFMGMFRQSVKIEKNSIK
jgi:hypothetical protein